jgi:hypothetical protein
MNYRVTVYKFSSDLPILASYSIDDFFFNPGCEFLSAWLKSHWESCESFSNNSNIFICESLGFFDGEDGDNDVVSFGVA